MKNWFIAVALGVISYGPCLHLYDMMSKDHGSSTHADLQPWSAFVGESNAGAGSVELSSTAHTLRAPGKIEGVTETVEIRARIDEQILHVHAVKGERVKKGKTLVELDSESLTQERNLAEALLELAIAKKQRLENGARASEIEAAKQELEALQTPIWTAERSFQRGVKLLQSNAISQQSLDELRAGVDSLKSKSAAAQARLKTLQLPARLDELTAANADVRAAQSRLNLSKIKLKHSRLTAPLDGQVLEVNARVGELAGPKSLEPLIAMVDTSSLHAVAEIDEFDALRVKIGQYCEITSDASEGVLATGHIVEIEPQMQEKKIFGQWAGERTDTFSRRVRIALNNQQELPIGLPIEVIIKTNQIISHDQPVR